MALIKCYECGAPISSDALKCPQCGAGNRRLKNLQALILGFILAAAIVAIVVVAFFGQPRPE